MNFVSVLFFALLFPFFLPHIFLLVRPSPPPCIPRESVYSSFHIFLQANIISQIYMSISFHLSLFFRGKGKATSICGIFSCSRNFSTIFNYCLCPVFFSFYVNPVKCNLPSPCPISNYF